MTSPRERVLQALVHERPDRTPRDFWAEAPTLPRLFAHLGVPDEEAALRTLGIDFRHLNAIEPEPRGIAPGVWQNYWGERFIRRDSGYGEMREDLPGALAGSEGSRPAGGGVPEGFEAHEWPTPDQFDYSQLAGLVRQHDEYALIYGFADVWQRAALVRGWERTFMDMAEHPDWLQYLCRKFVDFYKEDYTRAQEVAGGRIDLFLLLSDLGSQHGPLMSLAMFRQLVAPHLAEMIAHIHSLGARVLYHSCGAIGAFIPELITLGVDVLDPLQPVSDAMQPESLQVRYGGQVVFHGGLDMQSTLPHGTPEQVRAEALRYCEVLGQNGGYILAPTHLFQPDVPPENIVAMYEVSG